MTATTAIPGRARRDTAIVIAAALLFALLAVALAHRLAGGGALMPADHNLWLRLHLATVIPALPLGGWILLRRKGDRLHRMLGRAWAALMLLTALSSFGLRYVTGGLSPIHLLSVLVLVSVPLAVRNARRGNIAAHRRAMTIVYASLVIAGFFTFLPGRLMGQWLWG
ncbi:DUF2306 domain-containing protein [Sphingomonas sp. dw_22]|uniref:DUF2306 domain-containing protein n=1 Tax=Sphingomonas sp. dw_22 TaxID=2721175 RepID=UPI001BD2FD6A|nr:DUF2306 domain-containing protein [Sphingomonas sp. dw_22]